MMAKKSLLAMSTVVLFIVTQSSWAVSPLATTTEAWNIQALVQHANQSVPSSAIQAQLQAIHGVSDTPQNPETATQGNILIFVSFSMPEASLKQWLSQAAQIRAPVMIRGLIDDSFEATQAKIAALMPDNHEGMILEPRLFTDYRIQQVPAVVVRNTALHCSATQICPDVDPFDIVTGDVGLEAALNVIANQSDDATSHLANQALQRLRPNE